MEAKSKRVMVTDGAPWKTLSEERCMFEQEDWSVWHCRYIQLKQGGISQWEDTSLHARRRSSFTLVPHQAQANIRSS